MNLCEAIKKAHEQNKFVTNNVFKEFETKIKPDDTQNYCNLHNQKEKSITPRWEPGIDDFLNETWEVVD